MNLWTHGPSCCPWCSFHWCMAGFSPHCIKMCSMCNRRWSRTQSASSPSHLPFHLPEVASKPLRTTLLPNMPMQQSNDFEMALISLPQQWEQPYNLAWLSWVPASSQLLQSSQSTRSVAPLQPLVLAKGEGPSTLSRKSSKDILREAREMLPFQRILPDNKSVPPTLPHITIHPQVPCLKDVKTLAYNNCHTMSGITERCSILKPSQRMRRYLKNYINMPRNKTLSPSALVNAPTSARWWMPSPLPARSSWWQNTPWGMQTIRGKWRERRLLGLLS